jgi:hypothetical protein
MVFVAVAVAVVQLAEHRGVVAAVAMVPQRATRVAHDDAFVPLANLVPFRSFPPLKIPRNFKWQAGATPT